MELSFRRLVTRHDSRERKENRDPADMKERVPGHWVTTPQVLSLSWASGFLVLRLRDQRILHAPWREKNLRPGTQRLTRDREHQWPSRPPGTGTGALSLGVNLLSREGNSQKWRMKDKMAWSAIPFILLSTSGELPSPGSRSGHGVARLPTSHTNSTYEKEAP